MISNTQEDENNNNNEEEEEYWEANFIRWSALNAGKVNGFQRISKQPTSKNNDNNSDNSNNNDEPIAQVVMILVQKVIRKLVHNY